MWPATADEELLGLFEASAQNVVETARLLQHLLADYPDHAGLAEAIVQREHDGDRLVHDIVRHLARRGGQWPFETGDVQALAGALDDVVDHAEEAADQLQLYAVEAPMEAAQHLAAVLVDCAEELAGALTDLAAGEDMTTHLDAVHALESRGDRLRRAAVSSLFADGIDPITVIRWKDIFETLEAAVDACEAVANVLERIVLKASRRPAQPATASSSA